MVKRANAYGALTLPSAAGRWQLLMLDEDEISLTVLPYATIVKLVVLTLTEDTDYPDIRIRSFRSVLSGYPYYSGIPIIRISDYHEITDCI